MTILLCLALYLVTVAAQSLPSNNNPAFIAENGLVVINAESVPIVAPWKLETNVAGYTGSGYLRFDGNDPHGRGGKKGLLRYFFQIDVAGKYKLVMRLLKDGDVAHIANDCYIRVPGQRDYLGQIKKAFLPGRFPRKRWKFFTRLEVSHDAGIFEDPIYDFVPGTYELQIWGRSKNFYIDRIILYNQDRVDFDHAQDLKRKESPRVGDAEVASATITNVRLTRMDLIQAGENEYLVIQELRNGETIDLAAVGKELSIAVHFNSTVTGASFQYNGTEWTETGAPYTMRGDKPSGFVNPVPYLSTTGAKTVIVTANGPNGKIMGTFTVHFSIVDSRTGAMLTPTLSPSLQPVIQSPSQAPVASALLRSPVSLRPTNAPSLVDSAVPVSPSPVTVVPTLQHTPQPSQAAKDANESAKPSKASIQPFLASTVPSRSPMVTDMPSESARATKPPSPGPSKGAWWNRHRNWSPSWSSSIAKVFGRFSRFLSAFASWFSTLG